MGCCDWKSCLLPAPCRRISFKGTPTEEQVRETSLGLLTGYLGSVVDIIVSSAGRCPLVLRLAFKQLQRCVEKRFPGMEHQVGWALWGLIRMMDWAGAPCLGSHTERGQQSKVAPGPRLLRIEYVCHGGGTVFLAGPGIQGTNDDGDGGDEDDGGNDVNNGNGDDGGGE